MDLVLHFGEVEFPPVSTQHCSACQEIPTGSVGFEVYLDGDVWQDGTINLAPPAGGEVAIFVTTTDMVIFEAGCNDQLQCP